MKPANCDQCETEKLINRTQASPWCEPDTRLGINIITVSSVVAASMCTASEKSRLHNRKQRTASLDPKDDISTARVCGYRNGSVFSLNSSVAALPQFWGRGDL